MIAVNLLPPLGADRESRAKARRAAPLPAHGPAGTPSSKVAPRRGNGDRGVALPAPPVANPSDAELLAEQDRLRGTVRSCRRLSLTREALETERDLIAVQRELWRRNGGMR